MANKKITFEVDVPVEALRKAVTAGLADTIKPIRRDRYGYRTSSTHTSKQVKTLIKDAQDAVLDELVTDPEVVALVKKQAKTELMKEIRRGRWQVTQVVPRAALKKIFTQAIKEAGGLDTVLKAARTSLVNKLISGSINK